MARAKAASKKKTRSRKKKGTFSVDFEGVESGGGRPVPDGQYNAMITKITEEEGQNSGEPYLHAVYKVQGGKCDGATIHDNISLQPQSLWRLRTILECIGYEVEDGPMDIDPSDILEETLGVEVTNEDWEGRDRPRITGFTGADEEGEEEEEDEDPEEEEEEDPEEEEVEEEEEDEPPKKKKRKSRAKKIRVGSKVKFADEEGDYVKGVIVDMDDDTANVEDSAGDVWEVDVSELEAA
tara:strand:- start:1125 stop:1838 length:714 start_codon:yes stop_codon:yes gene_type:complete